MSLADHTFFHEPDPEKHVIVTYHTEEKLTDSMAVFFNRGLELGQLCIYASARTDQGILEELSSKIKNYEENVAKGNLVIVDLKPFYISIMDHDLTPFEEMKKSVLKEKLKRKDKHVRLYGDLVSFLFEQKNFEECFMLEKWWEGNPLGGTSICPYKSDVIYDPSNDEYKKKILEHHDHLVLC